MEETMQCPTCHGAMTSEPAFESFDEHMTLHITLWLCGDCGKRAEEIWADSMDGRRMARRISYAVREWSPPKRMGRASISRRRMVQRYAAA